jgi:hypothetical protein
MKWALASIGLLVVIVTFSLAALNQRNVVWNGDDPHCPHCRSEVRPYSNTCATCRKAFDWVVRETECEDCLSKLDRDWYTARVEAHRDEFAAALAKHGKVAESDVPDFITFMETWSEGSCGFCGGTGKWLAPDSPAIELDPKLLPQLTEALGGKCPVCFGSGLCIGCDGDRRLETGSEAAARELERLDDRLGGLDRFRDADSFDQYFRSIQDYTRRHAGRKEIRRLWSVYGDQSYQPVLALARLSLIQEVLDGLPVED